MNRRIFRRDVAQLVRAVRADISPEYRAFEDDDCPGIQLTIGTDGKDWTYQTGDNSFMGGAYQYPHWAVVAVYRSSNSYHVADEVIQQIDDLLADAP